MPCGCKKGGSCSCIVQGGLNLDVPGSGSTASPFRVEVLPAELEAGSTASVVSTVTGDGAVNSPFVLSLSTVDQGVDKWGRWVGTPEDYVTVTNPDPSVLYVASPPAATGFTNAHAVYVGANQIIAAYVGAQLVAKDDGSGNWGVP